MRRVHVEGTERVGANRLGRNGMHGRVHWEGLDGTGDGNEAWHTTERRKRPCVRPSMFEMGSCSSGGVWHTAKRRKRTCVGALRSKRGSCSSEGCGVPQNGTPRDTVHLHRRPPPASTSYCSSTVDLLQPPPATVHPRAPVHLVPPLVVFGVLTTKLVEGLMRL